MRDHSIRTTIVRPFATVRRWSRYVPTDLIAVTGFVLVATAVLTVANVTSPLVRAAVGFPLLFLAPGYVTVASLFPRSTPVDETEFDGVSLLRQTTAVSDAERAALSFGTSFALLPPLGLAIAATPWGFTQPVVVGAVSCFVLIGVILGSLRRFRVPRPDRYRLAAVDRVAAARSAMVGGGSLSLTAVNVALALSILLAVSTAGYALINPQQGERYTDVQLLAENESGDLVASDYPSAVEPDESIPVVVAVENHEGRDVDYTLVVQEERLEDGDVVERTRLDAREIEVAPGNTRVSEGTVTPASEAGTVRVSVLVYADDVPDSPTAENAYRHVYFSTDVSEDAGEDASDEG